MVALVTACGGGDDGNDAAGSGELTDVSSVVRDWGTEGATPISAATPHELRALSFASGSMGPKVEAACRFVEQTGGEAVIGSLAELDLVSRGEAGTWIAPAGELAVP